jgi:hypothetical protein
MSRWIGAEDQAEWAALFQKFTTSAYRLEAQQSYSNPTEDAALTRFRAGEPFDTSALSKALPRLRAQIASGRTQTRVRVVVEPPNDYTRLELVVYGHLGAAGEDIRIIAIPEGDWPHELPRYDYWLFDDRDIWRMHHHDDYTFKGAELLEDEDAIKQHLQWRNIALARSVPLHDYVAAGQTE